MIIKTSAIQFLKDTSNSAYNSIKTEFLYHSNKLEGSTFTKGHLEKYVQENIVKGSHKIEDVYETINSTKVFDFIVVTLNESLTKRLILEYRSILKENTCDQLYNGSVKQFYNRIFITYSRIVFYDSPFYLKYDECRYTHDALFVCISNDI